MNSIDAINEAGINYLIAENDLSSLRLTWHTGRKVRESKKKAQEALDVLLKAFEDSGFDLDELEKMTKDDGSTVLHYGIAEVLRKNL